MELLALLALLHFQQRQLNRYDWAQLLARVFSIDVLECPKCHSQMQRIAWITRVDSLRAILESVGLPADSPVLAPSRLAVQEDLFDAA